MENEIVFYYLFLNPTVQVSMHYVLKELLK